MSVVRIVIAIIFVGVVGVVSFVDVVLQCGMLSVIDFMSVEIIAPRPPIPKQANNGLHKD